MNITTDSDNFIIQCYYRGFKDELYGTTSTIDGEIALKVYKLGALHASIGKEFPSIDYLSISEILSQIKDI